MSGYTARQVSREEAIEIRDALSPRSKTITNTSGETVFQYDSSNGNYMLRIEDELWKGRLKDRSFRSAYQAVEDII